MFHRSRRIREKLKHGLRTITAPRFTGFSYNEKNQENLSMLDYFQIDDEPVNVIEDEVPLVDVGHVPGTTFEAHPVSSFHATDFRVIAYSSFILENSISSEMGMRMDKLMTTMYGVPPLYSSVDAENYAKKEGELLIKKTEEFCCLCGFEKKSMYVMCNNQECDNFNVKECSSSDTSVNVKLSIEKQFEDLVVFNANEIVQWHKRTHEQKVSFDEKELRTFPIYQKSIESADDFFNNNQILMPFVSFSDGVKMKRVKRCETTPTYLRFECIGSEKNTDGDFIVIPVINYSKAGVSTACLENYLSYHKDLSLCKFQMVVNDIVYTFRPIPLSYVGDMKELRKLTHFPNWNILQGCLKCDIIGTFRRPGVVTFNTKERSTDRTNFLASGSRAEIFDYWEPNKFNYDIFHCIHEGVLKSLLKETFKPKIWKNISNLKRGTKQYLVRSCKEILCHSQYGSFPKIDDNRVLSGSETMQLTRVMFPLIAAMNFYTCVSYGIFLLSWVYVIHYMENYNSLRKLSELLDEIKNLHLKLAPKLITMKFHVAYNHMVAQIYQFGKHLGGEYFEKMHKFLQQINQSTTRCNLQIPKQYLIKKKIKHTLLKYVEKSDINVRETVASISSVPRKKCENYDVAIGVICHSKIKDIHVRILQSLQLDCTKFTYYKRMKLHRERNFQVSGRSYWKLRRSSQSTMLCKNDNNVFFYATILLIFKNKNNSFQCLCEVLNVESFNDTFNFLKHLSPEDEIELKIIRLLENTDPIFRKVTSFSHDIVPINQIVRPSQLVPCAGSLFACCL